MTDANPGSARRWRAVFGRWPKTSEREKRDYSREVFGMPRRPKSCSAGRRTVHAGRVCSQKLREHAFG